MSNAEKTLVQLKKANKLICLSMKENGPRSFNRGVGAAMLMIENEGGTVTRDQLIERFGWSRKNLKNIVKKAQKKGFVEIADAPEQGYSVVLTDEGKQVIAKRAKANIEAADKVLSCLDETEIEQLNAITEKLILAAKAEGISAFGKTRKPCKGHCKPHCKRH